MSTTAAAKRRRSQAALKRKGAKSARAKPRLGKGTIK